MARENPGWGYTRVVGAMKNLGLTVGRMTVARVLAEHGIDPAPNRSKGMSWSAFLRAHWGAIAAADFFTVEALTLTGLTRFHVLFVIELKTRVVHIAGIVHEPGGEWVMQVGRNLLDAATGFLRGKTHLILDRDPVFTAQFRRRLKDSGVQTVRLAPKQSELERIRRGVRRLDTSRVSRQACAARRTPSATGRDRIRGPLPQRAESSGARQRID